MVYVWVCVLPGSDKLSLRGNNADLTLSLYSILDTTLMKCNLFKGEFHQFHTSELVYLSWGILLWTRQQLHNVLCGSGGSFVKKIITLWCHQGQTRFRLDTTVLDRELVATTTSVLLKRSVYRPGRVRRTNNVTCSILYVWSLEIASAERI